MPPFRKSKQLEKMKREKRKIKKKRHSENPRGVAFPQDGGGVVQQLRQHLPPRVGSDPSSETQGKSVGGGRNFAEKFSRTREKALGYLVLPDHFQTASRMPAPDRAQNILCIIVPNRRTTALESLSGNRFGC